MENPVYICMMCITCITTVRLRPGDLSYIEMHIQPVSKNCYAELLKYLDDMLLG